jgi:erythromycin esterase-like protein
LSQVNGRAYDPDIVSALSPVRRPTFVLLIVPILIFVGAATVPAAGREAPAATEVRDTDPIVHELCGKQIALLGESPVHGFGKTLEFKVELVRRLVDECHFNALFVESGIYDYLNIEKELKAGQDVSDAEISAAIGGIWATKEMQPLIPFLRERVKAGSLRLGGLDDQIGRGSYASLGMSADLVEHLQGDERKQCRAILERHMLWQYTKDAPYGPQDKARIVGCLDEIEARLIQPAASGAPWADEDKAMVASLNRLLARDFPENPPKGVDPALVMMNERDRSMYLNFQWLYSRLPKDSKVIVWAATVHIAKDMSGAVGFESVTPFGSYIHQQFNGHAFALGFSAYSGSYVVVRPPVRQLSVAPETSIEGRAFAESKADTVYLSLEQLRKFGSVEARPLGTNFKTAHWDEVLDGLVVFREERAPEYLNF